VPFNSMSEQHLRRRLIVWRRVIICLWVKTLDCDLFISQFILCNSIRNVWRGYVLFISALYQCLLKEGFQWLAIKVCCPSLLRCSSSYSLVLRIFVLSADGHFLLCNESTPFVSDGFHTSD
jgi:hypothetical protein